MREVTISTLHSEGRDEGVNVDKSFAKVRDPEAAEPAVKEISQIQP